MTSWLSSKKCLTASAVALALLTSSTNANAARPATSPVSSVDAEIRRELSSRKGASFDALLDGWHKRYGAKAVSSLTKLASDKSLPDASRYIALMGIARLGGAPAAKVLTPYLSDPNWMVRYGTLRALRALGNAESATAVIPLLKDPALVVRSEAVEAIEALKPKGAVSALIAAIESRDNYHQGKAQWVPQKALRALVSLNAKGIAFRLAPLLDRTQDPALQSETVNTLEALTGRKYKQGASLEVRVREWKTALTANPA